MSTNRHIAKAEVELYAATLVDPTNEAGGIEAVMQLRSQFEQILAYDRSHAELHEALRRIADGTERSEFVRGVFAECQPALATVLGVMAERGQFDLLTRVWNAFNRQIVEKLGVHVVDVTTRIELDDALRTVIADKARADLGGEVYLNETVDPSIIGGIIMSADGNRIDASVRTLLEDARNVLKKTTDGGEC